jgi:hypothetical protein
MAVFGKKDDLEVIALRQQLASAQSHIGELQRWITQIRGAETGALEAELRAVRAEVEKATAERSQARAAVGAAQTDLASVRNLVVETREQAILQEVGIYEYAHPLQDSMAYKDALADLKARIKEAAKGNAVTCQVDWAINGSVKEGQRMGRDIAKLMLRAYNTEADNAIRSVKPHTRDNVKDRLGKTRDTIAKLGALLRITVSPEYHRLRLTEIDLTADYLMRVEVEREAERAERERLREEAKVMKEIERERARLAKEREHYATAAAKLAAGDGADTGSLEQLKAKLAELDAAMASVEARAANIRTGYVYVISNIGAFGRDMVKIGMTRRLEPMDRVRELGDASVPFRFDCHALFFSEDAVSLENTLHTRFADRRVNLVNMRREFFYATADEVRQALTELGNDHILEYNDIAEAVEWRASDPGRRSLTQDATTPSEAASIPELALAGARAGARAVAGDGDLTDDGDA